MSFDVAADAYDRFMGRYSRQLSPQMADWAMLRAGQLALDVGCGPGALTAELASRLGDAAVTAVDPSPPFVEAVRQRYPGVRVAQASAERLPFADSTFDVALAQLVVHFMADPIAGLAEMARVTRAGGIVVACVWDHAGGRGPLGVFWDAVEATDPTARTESTLPGTREGELAELFTAAGLTAVESSRMTSMIECATFEEWWEPFTAGVGPAGAYVAGLDAQARARLRDTCRSMLPEPPFQLSALAWAARGVVAER